MLENDEEAPDGGVDKRSIGDLNPSHLASPGAAHGEGKPSYIESIAE